MYHYDVMSQCGSSKGIVIYSRDIVYFLACLLDAANRFLLCLPQVIDFQQFCPRWFFPKGTYLDKFLDKNEEYFPFGGVRGTVFFHDVDFAAKLDAVQGFVEDLRGQSDIIDAVDSWTEAFIRYSNNHFGTNLPGGVALNKVIVLTAEEDRCIQSE